MSSLTSDSAVAKTSRVNRGLKPRKCPWVTLNDRYEDDEVEETRPLYLTADNTLNEKLHDELDGLLPQDLGRGVWVRNYMLKVTTNKVQAIVLAQIIYWLSDGRGHNPQPHKKLYYRWTAQTSAGLASQTGLTDDQVDKALNWLRKANFLNWKNRLFNGIKQRHIWVNWRAITDACLKLMSQCSLETK